MSELTDWYNFIPQDTKWAKRFNYPNKKKIHIELPARFLICGPTGSGKTQTLLELIKQIADFDFIVVIAKTTTEPLYQFLEAEYRKMESTSGREMIVVSNTLDDLPMDYSKYRNSLVIIDDFMNSPESELRPVLDLWIHGRKQGVSMCWLTQNFFKTSKTIRQNSQYIILKQLTNKNNLKRILNELSLDSPVEEVIEKYSKSVNGNKLGFFMIDTVNPSLRFRNCFTKI